MNVTEVEMARAGMRLGRKREMERGRGKNSNRRKSRNRGRDGFGGLKSAGFST